MYIPRLVISGLSGGTGKTMLSLGLARAFARAGIQTRAFKKGPDYIDAAWLALAARAPQANLDPFFSAGQKLLDIFLRSSQGYDLALVEGNRGLFDGLDLEGSCSTSELARIITAPVLLILDCTKMTRTAAAVVKGCLTFENNLRIGGVILNRTGNDRHRAMVRSAVEDLCGVPVLGVLPRRAEPFIVERHMGLAGMDEHSRVDALLDSLADFVQEHTDLDGIRALAESAPIITVPPCSEESTVPEIRTETDESHDIGHAPRPPSQQVPSPVIAYVRDAAFWFYYRENLEALESAGATLLPLSLLEDADWPEIHGLYIGGGLPELHARRLCDNSRIRERVAALASAGLPIYAECGGLMYLARSLESNGEHFAMAGVFDLAVRFHDRPQGLGYVEALVERENPFHPQGLRMRGHEFHFSNVLIGPEPRPGPLSGNSRVLCLTRGKGMEQNASGLAYDGISRQNTFASYMHIYAPSLPHWAPRFVALGRQFLEREPDKNRIL